MSNAPQPDNEPERLARLLSLGTLDTLPQSAFDDITSLASSICGTPIALVSLVDSDRQWFKSRIGMELTETDRAISFCAHAILQPDQPFLIEDARQDERFRDNPLVTGSPDIRAYAGAPLVTAEGLALGTLCVIDSSVRRFSPAQLQALQTLARLVVTLLQHEEARRQEEERRTHEAQVEHERLVAMSTSGLDLKAYISPQYVYLHVNETYLAYWGCAREEVIGHTVRERLGAELFDDFIQPRLDMALAGQPVFFQHLHQYTGVGPRHMEVAMLPVRDAHGEVIGVVLRSHDIQALKEKEAELGETVALLEHRTREQQRFIHIMSHDLREPINSINNFASLLEADHLQDLPPMGQRYLGYVRTGGLRMGSLLDDLLSYVQLDNQSLKTTTVDLHQLALNVLDDLSSARERTQGQVELEALPQVPGDESLLRLALQNLIANGLKFCRPGVPPVVQVSATQSGGFVELSVADNGVGIPEEHQQSIFEIFQRLHSRKEYEGSGLGLSICRRIAELHGGTLTVQSPAGSGCRFTLHLPIAPNATP
jgi:PAS domain S-box-containing protein